MQTGCEVLNDRQAVRIGEFWFRNGWTETGIAEVEFGNAKADFRAGESSVGIADPSFRIAGTRFGIEGAGFSNAEAEV